MLRRLVATALFVSACSHSGATTSTPPAPSPVEIPFVPSDAACCLSIEQHVAITTPYGASEFDVFVETHETEVVLVGITSYGVRAFTVVHDTTGLHVDAAPLRELANVPFDRVVRDVYAAFLLASVDHDHEGADLYDRRDDTRLLARDVVFEPTTDHPDRVSIDYGETGWNADASPPTTVVVTHAQPALRIVVTTRSYARSP